MSTRLRHLVLCGFTVATTATQLARLIADFSALPEKIPSVQRFESGTNISPENLAQAYTHCFSMEFDNAAARDAYLTHPAHLAFVADFQAWLARVLVFDYACN